MACTAGTTACFILQQSDVINNLARSLGPVQTLIFGCSYLLGLMFGFKFLFSLKIYGEQRTMMSSHTNVKEPLMYLIVTAVFFYFPSAIETMMNTAFGYSNALDYTSISSANTSISALFGPTSPVGASLALFIQTIGLVAFLRGWMLVARSASQGQPPGGTGKGLMHVFGGILAINIVGTLEIINNTLYGY
jgi:intracellular multiplication protein IcmC